MKSFVKNEIVLILSFFAPDLPELFPEPILAQTKLFYKRFLKKNSVFF